jgi:PAS domain S-box-containing protein
VEQEATGVRSVRFQYIVGIGVWLLVVDFVFVGVMGHRLPRPLGVAGSWAFLGVSAALLAVLGAQRLARSREQARILSLQQGILHSLGALTEPSLAVLPADQLLEEMLTRLVHTLGVQTATIYLFSEDGSEFVSPASVGKEGAITKGHRLEVNRGVAGRIAAERQPITSDNPAEIGELASDSLRLASVAGCPIVVEDHLIGICVVGTTAPKPFSQVDIQLLQLVADRVGAGIERSRLDEAERRSRLAAEHAQGHVLLLGRASEALSTAIDDYEPNLAALVDAVVPDFADWCAVDVIDQAGSRRRLAIRHGEATSPEWSAELRARFPVLEEAFDRAAALGRTEHVVRPPVDGAPAGGTACLVVPIRVRGRSLGLITFANDPGRDAYQPSDVVAAQEVAIRTAITAERVLLYRELGGREARWRAVVEAAPAGIVEVDLDGRVLVWNQFAATMFGWESELPSFAPNPALPVETTTMLSALWARAAAGEEIVDAQVPLTVAGGEARDLAVSVAPLRAPDGVVQAILMLVVDVSERRRLQERLREAQRMDALGQVAGGVAHDFNNLLTVITGYADLLTRRLTLDDEDQRLLDNIRNAAERAAVLTGQLLTISRRQVPKPVVLAPDVSLRAVADVLQRILGIDIAVEWHLEADEGSVLIDPGRFEQLILNLAINARDAMPDGGRLVIATSATPAADGRQVCITVADTGVGMDAETRRRCFEPFFTTKDRSKGTGLGLAAVQGIVEEAGGVIAVDSQPGQGTMFTLRFPAVEVGEPVADVGPIPPSPLVRGSETVLVVDDEIDVRKLISMVLRRDGYLVLEACGGAEAIRIAQGWEGPIEMLVTDAVMPGMRGPEVATAVRALRPRIRTLLISGYTDRPSFPAEVVSDPLGFLAKPFKPSELADRVRKILDRSVAVQSGSPLPEPS